MKKNILASITAIVVAFTSTQLMAGKADNGKTGKFIPVCHKVNHPSQDEYPTDRSPLFTLWVPEAAVQAHLDHGDVRGEVIHVGPGGAFATSCEVEDDGESDS